MQQICDEAIIKEFTALKACCYTTLRNLVSFGMSELHDNVQYILKPTKFHGVVWLLWFVYFDFVTDMAVERILKIG